MSTTARSLGIYVRSLMVIVRLLDRLPVERVREVDGFVVHACILAEPGYAESDLGKVESGFNHRGHGADGGH